MRNKGRNKSMHGKYRVQVIDDGEVIFDTGEFDNLITDQALTVGQPFYSSTPYLCIGAGVVTAPTYGDTNLGNQVASKSMSKFSKFILVGTPGVYPELYKQSQEIEFTNIEYDLSELGIRRGGSTGLLVSRSLIKDENGNPVTVSVTSNQTVRITYSLYSMISSAVMQSGVFNAPFGTANYDVMSGVEPVGAGDSYPVRGIHSHFYDQPFLQPSSGTPQIQLRRSSNGSKYTSGLVTYAADIANKTTVATLHTDSKNDGDFIFDEILILHSSFPDSPGLIKTTPWIKLDSELTLPQYNELDFDITFTWDRYDSGA